MKNYDLTLDQMWDALQQVFGVSNQTLQVVTDINGYSEETLLDILYAVAGYRDFEQAPEMEEYIDAIDEK